MGAMDSWLASDVMVSDWSGAATEYAFALGRPVVYIDTPPKRMNPEWDRIGIESFEATIRRLVGRVVAPDEVAAVGAVVRDVTADASRIHAGAMEARDRSIFNVGSSSVAAARYLTSL
jgi:YidC/Oxa1 family membrane protein insertase